jgi:hypothetical protein
MPIKKGGSVELATVLTPAILLGLNEVVKSKPMVRKTKRGGSKVMFESHASPVEESTGSLVPGGDSVEVSQDVELKVPTEPTSAGFMPEDASAVDVIKGGKKATKKKSVKKGGSKVMFESNASPVEESTGTLMPELPVEPKTAPVFVEVPNTEIIGGKKKADKKGGKKDDDKKGGKKDDDKKGGKKDDDKKGGKKDDDKKKGGKKDDDKKKGGKKDDDKKKGGKKDDDKKIGGVIKLYEQQLGAILKRLEDL